MLSKTRMIWLCQEQWYPYTWSRGKVKSGFSQIQEFRPLYVISLVLVSENVLTVGLSELLRMHMSSHVPTWRASYVQQSLSSTAAHISPPPPPPHHLVLLDEPSAALHRSTGPHHLSPAVSPFSWKVNFQIKISQTKLFIVKTLLASRQQTLVSNKCIQIKTSRHVNVDDCIRVGLVSSIQLPETINSYREAFPRCTFSSMNVISFRIVVLCVIDKTAEKVK